MSTIGAKSPQDLALTQAWWLCIVKGFTVCGHNSRRTIALAQGRWYIEICEVLSAIEAASEAVGVVPLDSG